MLWKSTLPYHFSAWLWGILWDGVNLQRGYESDQSCYETTLKLIKLATNQRVTKGIISEREKARGILQQWVITLEKRWSSCWETYLFLRNWRW